MPAVPDLVAVVLAGFVAAWLYANRPIDDDRLRFAFFTAVFALVVVVALQSLVTVYLDLRLRIDEAGDAGAEIRMLLLALGVTVFLAGMDSDRVASALRPGALLGGVLAIVIASEITGGSSGYGAIGSAALDGGHRYFALIVSVALAAIVARFGVARWPSGPGHS